MTPVLNVADVVTPETFRLVADALPNTGVTNVGLVANTLAPEPVSSVNAAAKFVLDGVARNVATLAARPEIPVETGNPVQLVRVPELGVPNTGVTNVGLVESTTLPVPVLAVTPVPPLATGRVPVTPVVNGNPVQLVNVPELGVPNIGVVSVGDVKVLLVSVSVEDVVTIFTPSIDTTPADTLASVVSLACPSSRVPTPSAVDVDAVRPLIGSPVQLVRVPDCGVPNTGVTKVGEVANTAAPEPVSSVSAVASCSDVKEPNTAALPTDVT